MFDTIVVMMPDGTLQYGPGITPDEAVRRLLAFVEEAGMDRRAEVERLRAVTEAGRTEVLYQADRASRAMEIVQTLADTRWLATRESLRELIAKARALLAAQQQQQQQQQQEEGSAK